eukprot:CAMPEP_0202023040 /NCGR_PEP_ID=MMETSP0905-20130828/50937_1 /ASSEMBLY_ACC=CAM_ASM_000554 /TAXON_ID=420261 /ORGANISM="Thalassiosira antarctica, Strain CCMP982" /LENGTH=319 /DNA_ID=CAMNT_0048585327 /DNA_START=315 /DNA_END=1271 /DNA_ORIENTATION=-
MNKVAVKRKYVAYHHYHPQLLKELIVNQGNRNKTIDYIEARLIDDLGLWNNGYTEEDRYTGKIVLKSSAVVNGFVPVPSYKDAKRDYTIISPRYVVNKLILKCQEASEDVPRPANVVNKPDDLEQMDENNVDHLQHAVCILADESVMLKQRIRQLEAQMTAQHVNNGNDATETGGSSNGQKRKEVDASIMEQPIRQKGRKLCCTVDGCTKVSYRRGVCHRHGPPARRCKVEGCENRSKQGGVCIRHGAARKACNYEGCTNFVVRRGVCIRHGGGPTGRGVANEQQKEEEEVAHSENEAEEEDDKGGSSYHYQHQHQHQQ